MPESGCCLYGNHMLNFRRDAQQSSSRPHIRVPSSSQWRPLPPTAWLALGAATVSAWTRRKPFFKRNTLSLGFSCLIRWLGTISQNDSNANTEDNVRLWVRCQLHRPTGNQARLPRHPTGISQGTPSPPPPSPSGLISVLV